GVEGRVAKTGDLHAAAGPSGGNQVASAAPRSPPRRFRREYSSLSRFLESSCGHRSKLWHFSIALRPGNCQRGNCCENATPGAARRTKSDGEVAILPGV